MTERPVETRCIVQPVEARGTIPQVETTETVQPVESSGTVQLVEARGPAPQVETTETVQPVESRGTVQSVGARGTVPQVEPETVQPVETRGAVQPVESSGTVQLVEARGTVPQVETTGAVQPFETTGTVQPVETRGAVQPVESSGTLQSVEARGTVPQVETTETVQPVETTGIVQPVETTGTVQPVETTGTVQLAETRGTKQHVTGEPRFTGNLCNFQKHGLFSDTDSEEEITRHEPAHSNLEDFVPDSCSEDSEEIPFPILEGLRCLPRQSISIDDVLEPYETISDDEHRDEEDNGTTIPEAEKVCDKHVKDIYIRKVLKSATTKLGKAKKDNRLYNTRHYCLFCKKSISNFAQHVSRIHKKEIQVKKILDINIEDGNTSEKLAALRERRSFMHNFDSGQTMSTTCKSSVRAKVK